ncbi:MAG: DNA polymerase III subunit delta [Candidatus Lambdaproteobacteria bacterium]|nr:DNA polymerase III subunit delta [Candidatus Lambdaproteobacteria bacterium]
MAARNASPEGRLPPRVSLIYGNQAHAAERAAEAVLDAVLGEGARDFSLQRFDAGALLRPGAAADGKTVDDVRAAFETVPFLVERYAVLVKHVELLRAPVRKSSRKRSAADGKSGRPAAQTSDDEAPVAQVSDDEAPAAAEVLAAPPAEAPLPGAPAERLHEIVLRNMQVPPEGCWVVLLAEARNERDLPRALLTAAKGQGRIQKFVTYDDYEPIDWALEEARRHGLALERAHVRWLIQALGNDQGRLARELEKLALLFPPQTTPDEAAWRAAIHGEQHASLFFINEKLGERDLPGALAILEQFLGNTPGELPLLIGVLARHFRQLHRIREQVQARLSEQELAARLKVHPFVLGRLQRTAEGFSTVELERILDALARIDLGFRLHAQTAPMVLRDFVQRLCQGGFRDAGVRGGAAR